MNAAIAIAADATTKVNPGVSSLSPELPSSPPSWKFSSQDAGSIAVSYTHLRAHET